MKNIKFLTLFILVLTSVNTYCKVEEKKIVVVTTSFNNSEWYKKNLDSVFRQKYSNFCLIYVDDQSPDGTGNLVEQYITKNNLQEKATLIKNKNRHLALYNIYHAVHSCENDAIIVSLDGDDWLAHPNVFSKLNEVYSDPNVWITYGQFKLSSSGEKGWCVNYPYEIVTDKQFREYGHIPSHLRTFYAGLFKKIRKIDLLHDGNFYAMSWDMAFMFPMMEMAHTHFKFIEDVLYVYNDSNPISDHMVSKELQRKLDLEIRDKPVYDSIEKLF